MPYIHIIIHLAKLMSPSPRTLSELGPQSQKPKDQHHLASRNSAVVTKKEGARRSESMKQRTLWPECQVSYLEEITYHFAVCFGLCPVG